MSAELKLISRLRRKTHSFAGYVGRDVSTRSGGTRLSVRRVHDLEASAMNWMACFEAWDNIPFGWKAVLRAYGSTPEEALMNLEADFKQQEGQCNTN